MGDVHRLPNSDDTEREASAWFARMNADDVTADDRTRFEAWLRTQSCNAKAYTEVSATWQELVKSGPLVRAVYFGQVMNAALAPPASRRRWAAAAVAAGIGAIVLGAVWNLYKQKEETRFQTAIGEQARRRLLGARRGYGVQCLLEANRGRSDGERGHGQRRQSDGE